MAFALLAGELRLSISHSEEYILQAAYQAPEKYPELTKIWEEFYDSPVIKHDRSNRIVHELIELHAGAGDPEPALSHSIQSFCISLARPIHARLTLSASAISWSGLVSNLRYAALQCRFRAGSERLLCSIKCLHCGLSCIQLQCLQCRLLPLTWNMLGCTLPQTTA